MLHSLYSIHKEHNSWTCIIIYFVDKEESLLSVIWLKLASECHGTAVRIGKATHDLTTCVSVFCALKTNSDQKVFSIHCQFNDWSCRCQDI